MLEVVRRWERSPFFPQLDFTTAQQYLDDLSHQTASSAVSTIVSSTKTEISFPTWNDELYLELHRGCYTNHADQKWFNRRCEDMLYETELFASLSHLITGAAYPRAELEAAWKKVLLNQFHDILPGSSITAVFEDANRTWQEALETSWEIQQAAMQAIVAQIQLPPPPHPQAQLITVFNPLSWARSEVVALSVQQSQDEQACFWQICDLESEVVASQPRCWCENGETHCQIFFQAEVPAIGYRCYWLMPCSTGNLTAVAAAPSFVLENDWIRATIDPVTGNLSSL
jgi:alpha-mannosidase